MVQLPTSGTTTPAMLRGARRYFTRLHFPRCFASQTSIMEPTLSDINRTTTPTMLSDRTAPRRLCWVGPGSRGAGGVRRTQGSLQRFYPSRRRHGSREGPAEGWRGRRAERHVSRPGGAPLIETLPGPPSPSSLGSQESRPPDTRVWASGLLLEALESGPSAPSPSVRESCTHSLQDPRVWASAAFLGWGSGSH